jgi:hypothetical protein
MNPFNNYTTEELQAMSLCLKAELKTRKDIPSRTKAGAYAVDFIINRQLYVADIHVSKSVPQAPSDASFKNDLLAHAVVALSLHSGMNISDSVEYLGQRREVQFLADEELAEAKIAIEQAYKAHRETLPKKVKKGATRLYNVDGVSK